MTQQWKQNAILTFVLASAAVPAISQTLELGVVTLSLGMASQQVLTLFSEGGYKVMGDSTSTYLVPVVDRTVKHTYGLVQFTGGRLTYAERGWTSTTGDNLDAPIKALGALAQKGATSCSITHAPSSQPDSTLDRVFVTCGQRGVRLAIGRFNGIDIYDVAEFIGESH